MKTQVPETHTCKENPGLFTVENRGDGWYLYNGIVRGARPMNFCPYCGVQVNPDYEKPLKEG